jgi:hypothetical protein
MQQQIRGWRFAAERTRRRRPTRAVAPSARMMAGTAVTACRSFGRTAAARAKPHTPSVPAVSSIDRADVKRVAGVLGMVVAGLAAIRWMAARPRMSRARAPRNRWIMVTVNCSPQRLASRSDLPEPITRLGDAIDIKICPAPGDRGTELGARLRDLPRTTVSGMVDRRPAEDPRRVVERALREAKAMIEAGEVIRPDWPPSRQPAPQAGDLLEFAGRRGGRR